MGIGEATGVAVVVGVLATVVSGMLRALRSFGRRVPLGEALLDGAIIASLAAVLVATLSPLASFGTVEGPPEIVLTPLERLNGAPVEFAVINLLLLVPTIVLLAQRWRRAGVIRLTLVGALLSATIEAAQLLHPERGTNVDDLLLNTVGAAGAAMIGVALRWVWYRRPPVGGDHDVPARRPLEAELDPPFERSV